MFISCSRNLRSFPSVKARKGRAASAAKWKELQTRLQEKQYDPRSWVWNPNTLWVVIGMCLQLPVQKFSPILESDISDVFAIFIRCIAFNRFFMLIPPPKPQRSGLRNMPSMALIIIIIIIYNLLHAKKTRTNLQIMLLRTF